MVKGECGVTPQRWNVLEDYLRNIGRVCHEKVSKYEVGEELFIVSALCMIVIQSSLPQNQLRIDINIS